MTTFRILGPIEFSDGERRVSVGGPRQVALLAFLLVHANQAVSADRLIDELWGSEAPRGALKSLHVAVSRLRRALDAGDGESRLRTAAGGYLLAVAPGDLDADEFATRIAAAGRALEAGDPARAAGLLGEALAMWRGPPLAEVAYEPFAQGEIRRLEELRLTALEARGDAELELGRHAALIGDLQQLVAEHPARERLAGQLMVALYRCGRQAEALEAYQRTRAHLATELGLEPGPALKALQAAVLAQSPALQAAAAEQSPAVRAPAQPVVSAGRPARRRAALGVVLALAALIAGLFAAGRRTAGSDLSSIGADAVGVLIPASGRVEDRFALDGSPAGLAASADAMWLAGGRSGTVARIDAEQRRVVDTIPVGADATAVAAGSGAIWAISSDAPMVVRIAPHSGAVVRRIRVGNGARAVAAGAGAVWVANALDATVSRIDPGAGRVVATIPVGARPSGVASAAGAVWVANEGDGTVTRIDPRTDAAVATVGVGSGPAAIAGGRGAVWVVNGFDGTVSRIDPQLNAVTATASVPGADSLTVAPDAVWVGSGERRTVSRVEPASGQVTRAIAVHAAPSVLAVAHGRLWIGTRAMRGARRGGTLTMHAPGFAPSIDPAITYDVAAWAVVAIVGDGLVGYRRAGGTRGMALVPDLAQELPEPADGGLTYRFELREGVRYSNGAPVRARDVRASIERAHRMRAPSLAAFPLGLRGERACGRRRCDLRAGIGADDANGVVTFRLARPNPDFLSDLAASPYIVLPAGTPTRDITGPSFPATGPYRVAALERRHRLVLARNPAFRPWSPDAQPEGLPDRIEWLADRPAAGADVEMDPSPRDLRRMAAEQPDRVHVSSTPSVGFMWLNTRVAPFDRAAVRRAIAYATDRAQLIRAATAAGSRPRRPTCQTLPPNFPGHVPYCPYSLRPAAADPPPDLDRARRLVARSGTAGTPVVVYIPSSLQRDMVAIGRWYVRLLRRLGYPARLARPSAYAGSLRRGHGLQMGWSGWIADAPLPSFMLRPLFACGADYNQARYCDARVDRTMRRARVLEANDAAASARLWASVDRAVVRSAAVIPVFTSPDVTVTSARVRDFQVHPSLGPLLAQTSVTCAARAREC